MMVTSYMSYNKFVIYEVKSESMKPITLSEYLRFTYIRFIPATDNFAVCEISAKRGNDVYFNTL